MTTTFRDTWLTCSTCGQRFIWRIEEQRALAASGALYDAPAHCPAHRPAPEPEPFGRIKWFSAEKGYGFLIEPTGEQLFFHRSGVALGIEPVFPDGSPVTYEVEYTVKGPQAINVAPYRAEEPPTG